MLPTHKHLLALRRGDVVRAIKMHGGSATVAGRLGLRFQHGSLRYRLFPTVVGQCEDAYGYAIWHITNSPDEREATK